jgi:hypothetical protein
MDFVGPAVAERRVAASAVVERNSPVPSELLLDIMYIISVEISTI